MKISLITINRNNAKGLKATLCSIAAQLAHLPADVELEHIIVDGESSDHSLSVIDPKLRSNLFVVPPKGVYNAINTGLTASTGDVVGLLHSGDTFSSDNILATVASYFEKNKNIDYIYGDAYVGRRFYQGEPLSVKMLTEGFAPPHLTLYVRRNVLDKHGLYDETYRIGADFDYFARLAVDSDLSGQYLPLTMVDMEGGGISQSLFSRLWTNNTEKMRALRKNRLPASRLAVLRHYSKVIKGYLCSSKQN